MQILIQYMKNTNIPLEQKIRFYESLKEPGIGVPKHHLNEICQLVKNLLTNKSRRIEGLILLDLVVDKIPDQIFSDHLVFFLKQIVGMSANESHAETCFGLLNRLIVRSKSMLYMLRDIRNEVFPQLIQLVTRELAKVPVSCALLSLTQAVVSLFAKSCGPNREPMERFLFKQIVQAELLNKSTCDALAKTLATLSKCVADPETRHDVQTSYLDLMIRSCFLTEKLYSQTQEIVGEDFLSGTIYAVTGHSAVPEDVDHLQAKLIVWRRLLFQLDVVGVLLGSSLSKRFSSESLFKLLNTVLVSGGRDEHLSFLHPSLILKTMNILRLLIRRFGDQLIVKNNLLVPIFMDALDVTLLHGTIDLSFMRTNIYEVMTEWLGSCPPSAFYRNQPDSLMKIVKLSCEDVTTYTGPNQVALVMSALALQRAIVLTYGHRDKDHVRTLLMQLIPYAIDLTAPFKGVFCISSACRQRVYELLVAFCINSNATLLPPTAEIGKLVAEGMCDDDHQIRDLCRDFRKIVNGIINPVECGFSKSYSHALNEHNREAKRLQLTRAERTRPAETQTIDGSLRPPRTLEKATNTEVPTARQAQVDAAIRAISRPGPKSQKKKLVEDLSNQQIVSPSDEDDDDGVLDEDPDDMDDDEDLDAEDESEDDYEAMDYDQDELESQDFRERPVKRRRKIPISSQLNGSDAAVIIADDDDDDDDVVITRPCSSRDAENAQHVAHEGDDDDDGGEIEEPSSDNRDILPINANSAPDDERNIVEEVDDDEEDNEVEDDEDMCVITDPTPARAEFEEPATSGPNENDVPGESEESPKVLAVLTPLEDPRANGDERTKDAEYPVKEDMITPESTGPKVCSDEGMLEAVIVPITADDDDDEVAEGFKAPESIEPIKATESVKSAATEGTA